MLAGTIASAKILQSKPIARRAEDCAKKIWATKNLKNTLEGVCKLSGFGIQALIMTTPIIILGAFLGNALFDAPINQEFRDQADGEAVRKAMLEG